jgi:hypothetical protein
MGLKEMKWSGMDWIHIAQDMENLRALVNMAMNEEYYLLRYNTV